MEEIKSMIFTGEAKIDDPIDLYTCHTLLHDAVILNRTELFDFLLSTSSSTLGKKATDIFRRNSSFPTIKEKDNDKQYKKCI